MGNTCPPRRDARRRLTLGVSARVAVVATVFALAAGSQPGVGADPPPAVPAPWSWTPTGVWGFWRSQGLASDPTQAPATSDRWYTSTFTLERSATDGSGRGLIWSLPLDVVVVGKHSHTGDPDAFGGRVVVPWENKQLGPSNPPSKAWGVYDGASMQLLGWSKHVLVPGETADNPWVTISPDGAWMVSGPYAPLDRLEVFATARPGWADIALSSTIAIDRPPSNVQGCDMVTSRLLVCASDHGPTGKQIFTIELDAPIGAGAATGRVTQLGSAPQAPPLFGFPNSFCSDSGEVEGIDAQPQGVGDTLVRLLVIDRCSLIVHEYSHVIRG